MDRAGDGKDNCWAGIFSPPMEKMDFSFIKENGQLMLELYENARRLACNTYQEEMVDALFMFTRYHIAIATHTDMWVNGNDESRALYKENLDIFVAENQGGILFLDWGGVWKYVPAPGSFDYNVNPMEWMHGNSAMSWNNNYNF